MNESRREAPVIAMRVRDIDATIAFYHDAAGFPLVERLPEPDVAILRTPRGASMLVAGPNAHDLTALLGPDREPLDVGMTPSYICTDLAALETRLAAHGISGAYTVTMPWGDRRLSVLGPDGYRVLFVSVGGDQLTSDAWFDLYRRGVDDLKAVLTELDTAELDLSRGPGEWTIRQIVHHIADGDASWTTVIKVALATPGRPCDLSFYRNNDEWPTALAHATRDVAPSAALLAASRAHVAQLLDHVSDPWNRSAMIRRPDGHEPEPITVLRMIEVLARHALEHVEEIREIRRALGPG